MKINWLDWSKKAFEKAKTEGKPILLDIHGVWCYWCHRMDADTYENPSVIKIVNEKFIPIKVDTDERPDINSRYNTGGWPSTVFLTPDGMPIEGQTYVQPAQMVSLLNSVSDLHKNSKEKLILKAPPENSSFTEKAVLFEEVGRLTAGSTLNYYDALYGGFLSESGQKFPMIDVLEFALAWHKKTKNKKFLDIITTTLQNMWRGGIHDRTEGGFFRYATQRDWNEPHYEKMLEDNAGLLKLCAEVFEITKDEFYKNMAEDIIAYVRKYLSDKNGGFYASQDADEEYYKLSAAEREKRDAPRVDKTIYANLNAEIIASYFVAAEIFGRNDLSRTATKNIDYTFEKIFSEGLGVAHSTDKKLFGLLSDNVSVALAIIAAYESTNEKNYLINANDLAEFILKKFYDKKLGGFFDIRHADSENFGLLKFGRKDAGENADAAILMIKLWQLTKKKIYRYSAEKTLELLSRHAVAGTIMGAPIAMAFELFLGRKS